MLPVRAARAAPHLGPGLRARQGRRAADRRRAPRAPPPAPRGDGRGRLRLVGAAPPSRRAGRRAARLRRRPDGHRRHARRDRARARRGPRRAQRRASCRWRSRPADGGARLPPPRGARRGERPAAPLQRRAVVRPHPRGAPRRCSPGSTPAASAASASTARASPPTAAFTFTFEDWNLFDDDPAWLEATLGTPAERKAKLADPARRPRLRGVRVGDRHRRRSRTSRSSSASRRRRKPFENLTLGEVAARTGKHPVDAMLDVAVADDLRTRLLRRAREREPRRRCARSSTTRGSCPASPTAARTRSSSPAAAIRRSS